MLSKITLCLLFLLNHSFLISADDFFKVPLEIREKNRPKRLVDDANDPDLKKLKSIQDQFFHIVGNSSLGKEFKSFSQVLNLVDSNAGRELGKLIVNGVMIGFAKQNSNQILTEFLDDFQYRVSPEFADAVIDYKDFLKTVDLKMIPLTIETLFRKDELGNSFAQLPLGQLVDLIQPEASKYGIDIRSLINGILGKGDKTFPDLVEKIIKNFNISSLLNGLSSFASEDANESERSVEENHIGRPRNDQPLMLFKPIIAKLLKENQIDLEADAVIQVLTPLLGAGGQSLKNMFQGNGKDFNIAELMPLLGLLSSFGGNKNKNSKTEEPNIMQAAMSLMGGLGNNNDKTLETIMNIGSMFMKNNDNTKRGGNKNKLPSNEVEEEDEETPGEKMNLDPNMLMQMVSNLAGDSKNGNGNGLVQLAGLAKLFSGGGGKNDKVKNLIQIASNFMKGITKKKDKNSSTKDAKRQNTKKSNSFPVALEMFLRRIQTDKKCHTKIKDAFSLITTILYSKFGSFEQLKKQAIDTLKPYKSDIETKLEGIEKVFSYSQNDWDTILKDADNVEYRNALVSNTKKPASDIVSLVTADGFQRQQNIFLKNQLGDLFTSFGVKRVSLKNFPGKLAPLITMVSKGWDLPVDVGTLLEPLQVSLKDTWDWYTDNVQKLQSLPRNELEQIVAESLENDFATSLIGIWKASKASKSYKNCLPRSVCELVGSVAEENALQLLVARLGSIVYGGFRANAEDDFLLFLQVTRAAVLDGSCQEYFPIQCDGTTEQFEEQEEDDVTVNDEHTEL